ncbi:MAG: NfeD family protein [Dictyoglomaceae bacterium]
MKKFLIILLLILPIFASTSTVYLIPIKGTIDLGLASFVERSIRENPNAKAFIFEIDTFGGRVDAAVRIRDAILNTPILTIAFIKDRAWSAGALIAIACQKIIISPSGSIGAAEPRPADEKTISALKSEFESTAEKRKRDPRIAGGMVDKNVVIPGLKKEGEILSLSAIQAKKWKYADEILEDINSVLKFYKLEKEPLKKLSPTWSENLARFITDPTFSSILLTVGMLSLYVAILTPGLGIPEILALLCLGLFFGGHMLAGLAGWEPLLLFILGLILVVIEIHTPGFGVAGITGSAAIFFSIFWLISSTGNILQATLTALFTISSLIIFLAFYLPKSKAWEKLGLPESQRKNLGYVAVKERKDLIGKRGKTLTMLRPTGFVEIDGEKLEVYSESEYLPPETEIEVIRVEGNKIFVRRV